MKHLIVVVGTLILGCIIFSMIAGPSGSLRESCAKYIENNIDMYKEKV